MARANTILTHYRDEVGRLATVTVDVGTDPGDPNYGPDILVNDNPAQVAKILDPDGAWLLEMPARQPVTLAAILHHNLFPTNSGSPTIEVLLQGNQTDSWGSPSFEAAFAIPAAWNQGTTRAWPIQPWMDLTAQTGYEPLGFLFWRLLITSNDQDIQVGGLKLYSDHLILESDMREGWQRTQRKPIIRNTTAFQVTTKYSRGTTLWASDGSLFVPTDRADLMETHWFDQDGSAYPFVIVPNGLRNACRFVERTEDFRETVRFYSEGDDTENIEIPFAVQELGRGLRPGT